MFDKLHGLQYKHPTPLLENMLPAYLPQGRWFLFDEIRLYIFADEFAIYTFFYFISNKVYPREDKVSRYILTRSVPFPQKPVSLEARTL